MFDKHKICLAASAGGHMSQLLSLSPCWNGQDVVYVTTTEVLRTKLEKFGKVYIVGECNRNHPFRVIKVFAKCIEVIWKEKPGIVISTGAASGCMLAFLAKMIGAKIVWIDSITNVEKLSLSGRMVRYIADLFLVQWPELENRYKRVEYMGAII